MSPWFYVKKRVETTHRYTLLFGETTELTGGEYLVLERCVSDEVRKEFQFYFDRYMKVIEDNKTSDLSDSQPTKGNIEGGLTTIEEKALGNVQKIGWKAPIVGCLEKAVAPPARVSGSRIPLPLLRNRLPCVPLPDL
jgi:altronate dehydratase